MKLINIEMQIKTHGKSGVTRTRLPMSGKKRIRMAKKLSPIYLSFLHRSTPSEALLHLDVSIFLFLL